MWDIWPGCTSQAIARLQIASCATSAKSLLKAMATLAWQGSTDGIGKELAKQLAKKGLNIVLVGRTPSKLTAAKAEVFRPPCSPPNPDFFSLLSRLTLWVQVMEKAPSCQVKEIQFDFASASKADYDR